MHKIWIFFRLVRWPNLVFIAVTQVLFYQIFFPYAYHTSHSGAAARLRPDLFYTLLVASVLIAAAGYIINDYFDVNIDIVNKPRKVIIGRYMNRRAAILWHSFLTLCGLCLSGWAAYRLQNISLLLLNTAAAILLLFYSTTFKRKLLIGNVVISLLTSWVVLVLAAAEYRFSLQYRTAWQILFRFSLIYAGFAFVISLIREVIKDMEDLPGDMKHGCTTMPVVWGMAASKVFAGVWITALAGAVAVMMVYLLIIGKWLTTIYGIIFIVFPLGYALKQLYDARVPADFHKLSRLIKGIMLTGILSILFFITF